MEHIMHNYINYTLHVVGHLGLLMKTLITEMPQNPKVVDPEKKRLQGQGTITSFFFAQSGQIGSALRSAKFPKKAKAYAKLNEKKNVVTFMYVSNV